MKQSCRQFLQSPRHLPLGRPHLLCTSVAAWRLDVSAGSTSR